VGKNFITHQNFGVFTQAGSEADLNVRSSGVIDGRLAAIGQASISNLRCERQLEISVQAARKRRPDLSDDALLALAKTVHGLSGQNV